MIAAIFFTDKLYNCFENMVYFRKKQRTSNINADVTTIEQKINI